MGAEVGTVRHGRPVGILRRRLDICGRGGRDRVVRTIPNSCGRAGGCDIFGF